MEGTLMNGEIWISFIISTEWEEKNKNLWNTSSNTRKDLSLILIRFLLARNWISAEFWSETPSLALSNAIGNLRRRKVLQLPLVPLFYLRGKLHSDFFRERCRFPLLELFLGEMAKNSRNHWTIKLNNETKENTGGIKLFRTPNHPFGEEWSLSSFHCDQSLLVSSEMFWNRQRRWKHSSLVTFNIRNN